MHMSFQLFCTANLPQMFRPLVQHIFRMSSISRRYKMYFSLFATAFCAASILKVWQWVVSCILHTRCFIHGHAWARQIIVQSFQSPPGEYSQWRKKARENQHAWQPQLYQELPFSMLKIGTECPVHSFQCGTVLSGHE